MLYDKLKSFNECSIIWSVNPDLNLDIINFDAAFIPLLNNSSWLIYIHGTENNFHLFIKLCIFI